MRHSLPGIIALGNRTPATMTTLIVIPCYNEALRLDCDAFISFLNTTPNISLLFVNDGSTDNTAAVLDAFRQRSPLRVTVFHLPQNAGKAEAIRQGFQKGFTLNAECIAYLDADLAAPLTCIKDMEFLMRRDGKHLVMGSRVALLGRRIERQGVRHYAGRLFATAASLVLGVRLYDTQCGAKIFLVNDRLKQIFAAPFTVKWIFDVEILARFRITPGPGLNEIGAEYPLHEWVDKKGSKLKPIDFVISGLDLLKIMSILRKKSLTGA